MKPVAIGVSAGGPETLRKLFGMIDDLKPPILLAQHNLANQMESFGKWLESVSKKEVFLVKSDQILREGSIHIPASGFDLVLKTADTVGVEKSSGTVTPSIDRLFISVARTLKKEAIAVVLGGLGRDGVAGALEIVKEGGTVVVQTDAKFPFLPKTVLEEVDGAMGKSLDEIALFLEYVAR